MSAVTRGIARLEQLAARVELVGTTREAKLLYRVAAPIFDRLGWRPKLQTHAVRALVEDFRANTIEPPAKRDALFTEAIDELEENLVNVERLAAVRRRPPVAHAAWLRRTYDLLVRAGGAVSAIDPRDARERAIEVAHTPMVSLLSPLNVERAAADARDDIADIEARMRVVELELAAVDHLLAAGRAELDVLARRRRLFEAARQVLLDTDAALPLEVDGVTERKRAILAEILRLNRLESAGVDFEVGLAHQGRSAIARGESARLRAIVAALDHVGRGKPTTRFAQLARRAHAAVFGGASVRDDQECRASFERSSTEQLGDDVVGIVRRAVERVRKRLDNEKPTRTVQDNAERAHFAAGADHDLLVAALAVDGAFELGGTLNPVRVVSEQRRLRRVTYPTQTLELVAAEGVEDIPNAIIEDPRLIVLQLATGRLLARRFVREEVERTPRIALSSEVRVFLLDGSGSMIGPRARVRDAMLVAELATLIRRLTAGDTVRCCLYFAFFNSAVGPIVKIDSVALAERAIADVCSTVQMGGTDIQAALLAAFDVVTRARESDRDLAKAQVVLVTDGNAPVDEAIVVAARELASDKLTLGVSVVALGTENPALRQLVAHQRAKGERAFYHYVDDDTLVAMVEGSLDDASPIHQRETPETPIDPKKVAVDLEHSCGDVVRELEDLARGRDLEALEQIESERQALREVGIVDLAVIGEGERARIESIQKDHASLRRRYARWFPDPENIQSEYATLESADLEDAESVQVMLASIVEVVAVVGGSELARMSDAIDLIERLMPDAGLTPRRYLATLAAHTVHVRAALVALHAETSPKRPETVDVSTRGRRKRR
ncbi:MAG: VWA domain-containing protein [Myxococcales bacterium]|nr:VWA domain-containing protein [Myxococcales bacterium]